MKPAPTPNELRLAAPWAAIPIAAGLMRLSTVSLGGNPHVALATLALQRQPELPYRSPSVRWPSLGPAICPDGDGAGGEEDERRARGDSDQE
jgi:hypothetical protein